MSGFVRDQAVHLLADPTVRGMTLGGGPQLEHVHRLSGVHLDGEADAVREGHRVRGLVGELGRQRVVETGRDRHGLLVGLGQARLDDGLGDVVAVGGRQRLPLDRQHPVPLEVPEGPVVAQDVEPVVGALEGPAGLVAPVRPLSDVRAQQRHPLVGREAPHPRPDLILGQVRVRIADGGEELLLALGIEVGEYDRRSGLRRLVAE